MTRLAFFDIDGTITTRSTERMFLRWLVDEGYLSYGKIIAAFFEFILRGNCRRYNDLKKNKLFYKGLSVSRLEELSKSCFEQKITNVIRDSMREEVKKLKLEGFRIVLLSGSISELVRPMADYMGTDDTIASFIEVKHGLYTGQLVGRHPYGKNKKILAEEYCSDKGLIISEASCYANESKDVFLMEVCGVPVAVAPDKGLRKTAVDRKWKIIEA